jgi:hypothetical protein
MCLVSKERFTLARPASCQKQNHWPSLPAHGARVTRSGTEISEVQLWLCVPNRRQHGENGLQCGTQDQQILAEKSEKIFLPLFVPFFGETGESH